MKGFTPTSYCSFCFPAGIPVASWILTFITDTWGGSKGSFSAFVPVLPPSPPELQCGEQAELSQAGQEDELRAWSERGRVNTSTWPFSFHSVLSCMLGTWTLTVTGPYGKTQIKSLRAVITQHQTKYLYPYLDSSVNTLKCVYKLLHCSHNKTFSWISLPFVCHLSSITRTDSDRVKV